MAAAVDIILEKPGMKRMKARSMFHDSFLTHCTVSRNEIQIAFIAIHPHSLSNTLPIRFRHQSTKASPNFLKATKQV